MGLYRRFLPEWFGPVPVRDIGLLASEGRMSIPVEDGVAAGVLDVTTQFFEFIPAGEYGRPAPAVLRCHELQVGGEYFILLTNAAGLCRYDIGDRVRVTGFVHTTPVVEFLSKADHICSLTGEKLTEDQVVQALQGVAAETGAALETAVLAPQFDEVPWYRLYVDADALPAASPAAGERIARRLDEALRSLNLEYGSKRDTRRLGPVDFFATPPGFLAGRDARLRAAVRSRAEQFKHQYLLARLDADVWRDSLPLADADHCINVPPRDR
jgi:hypothetical protein